MILYFPVVTSLSLFRRKFQKYKNCQQLRHPPIYSIFKCDSRCLLPYHVVIVFRLEAEELHESQQFEIQPVLHPEMGGLKGKNRLK